MPSAPRCRPLAGARGGLALALIAAAIPALAASGRGGAADTLPELWRALGACARITGVPSEAAGSEVTVLFSLRRDGSLQGQPRITHARLLGNAGAQRAFVAGALAAVAGCLPVAVSDGLGGAIAGRPLRLRLTSHRPERAI